MKSVGGLHGDAPNRAVAYMLGHFQDKVIGLIVDCRVGQIYSPIYGWKVVGWESDIHDRSYYLHNLSLLPPRSYARPPY